MWIWIANKFAKFHAKRLNRSENIPKSLRGGLFFETPCTWQSEEAKILLIAIPLPSNDFSYEGSSVANQWSTWLNNDVQCRPIHDRRAQLFLHGIDKISGRWHGHLQTSIKLPLFDVEECRDLDGLLKIIKN